MDILQRLSSNGGYVLHSDIEEMIRQFGEDYQVVIKYYCHDREFMSLKNLKNLSVTNSELEADIREVFISSNEYERMFGNVMNNII